MRGPIKKKKIKPQGSPGISHQDTQSLMTRGVLSIVGVGASAGGLEALEQLLGNVSEGRGIAYVIVQHLDPTHKGIMPELLQRMTHMKVTQVKDRTPVKPDQVYVIPPNKDMSVLHGVLHLLEPISPRGLRLPIDFFFRSLAEDQREHSVGIILSGMGTDGTLGIKAIKELGGLVLVQDPATAKFDSMPRSAIGTGLVDYVAPAKELCGKLIDLLQYPHHYQRAEPLLESKAQSALEKIIILLRTHTGQDFSLYKKGTLYRRIERRMGIHQIDKIAHYVRFLQENSQELELLFKELLIGVTNFFRDQAAWEYLKEHAIPSLLASRPDGGLIRAWIPGCSTGEEAYSLAIVFKEALDRSKLKGNYTLQIYATDLDKDAIDKARRGAYPSNIAADVSPERLHRFFVKEESGGYRVVKDIREMVIMAVQNVIMDPPFTKLDILICRNLLIYLTPELQKKILPLFHYSLNPGGILFLGSAETTGSSSDLFTPLERKWRIYRRKESHEKARLVDFPSSFLIEPPALPIEAEVPAPVPNLQSLTDQLILQQFCPPAVLINDKGDILYITGKTGKYLEPAAGKANWNIFAMAREGLHHELSRAFQKVVRQKGNVTIQGLKVRTNGKEQIIDFTLQAIEEPEALQGMFMVVFKDVATSAGRNPAVRVTGHSSLRATIAELEQESKHLREDLLNTREEMQTSQEELKATNEELQSANEELQSTNEELTTSKEEMQSLNEELQTVNAELQSNVDELSRLNNDMKNLFNSTDIATVFLDKALNLQRFTTQTTRIIKLIPGDVGRLITDIASDLIYPEMPDDIRDVLQTLVFVEKQVTTPDGRWFLTRIMPYRTLEDKIDGVVITFTDITIAKTLEMELRRAHDEVEAKVAERTLELAKANEELLSEIAKHKQGRIGKGKAQG
ncbi:MAG: chemotaxis protein CheB [Desulfomonilia bacterium]